MEATENLDRSPQIYDRITTRLAGRRFSYIVGIEQEDMMAVRGLEVDRLGKEIGPIILGKSSILRRTPMELNGGHLRPIQNPCGRCRLSVPERWKCNYCERMICYECELQPHDRQCSDCRQASRRALMIANS